MWYGIKQIVAHYKSKAHWYLKYLIWGFIVIVCFAILVQIFKDTNCLATWLFDFFSAWAVVIGATATLILVLAAFLAIMDNRHVRVLDRRERHLNEMIEWAIAVAKCMPPSMKYLEKKDLWENKVMTAMDEINKYELLEGQGEYVKLIAYSFKKNLGGAVKRVLSNIKKRQILLVEYMSTEPAVHLGEKGEIPKDLFSEMKKIQEYHSSNKNTRTLNGLSEEGKAMVALGENGDILKKSTSRVIEEATKIKTKDIS